MAKLIVESDDIGKVIPIGGEIFWSVYGSSDVDSVRIAAETSASMSLGGSVDQISFDASGLAYNVRLDGVSAVFAHNNGSQITIPMNTEGDQLTFGGCPPLELKIDTSEGQPKFLLGTQELTTEATPVSCGEGGNILSVDNKGTPDEPAAIDAGTAGLTLTDAVNQFNNVVVSDFGADDSIKILGGTPEQYDSVISTNDLGDVNIAFNNAGVLNQITLVGVAINPDDGSLGFAFDVASFNALPVGDLDFI
jgi:hypothetical protein